MAKTVIRHFRLHGVFYQHELDLDNDTVMLKSFDGEEFLSYDSSMYVKDLKTGNSIGKISLVGGSTPADQCWEYRGQGVTIRGKAGSARQSESHLDMEVIVSELYLTMLKSAIGTDNRSYAGGMLAGLNPDYKFTIDPPEEPYIVPRDKPSKKNKLPPETLQTNLARRLEEYIEYAHAAKRFTDVGFYEELLEYIEPNDPVLIYSHSEEGFWSNEQGWVDFIDATEFRRKEITSLPMAKGNDAEIVTYEQASLS